MQSIDSLRNRQRKWYLKAQDELVCSITDRGIVNIVNENLMPFDLYLEETADFDMLMNNVLNFYWWCSNRVLSLDRTYAKSILNAVGLQQAKTDKERAAISLSLNCVSLKDFYWVTEDLSDTWCKHNLFQCHLGDIVDIALLGKALTVTNRELVEKDISTDGVAPKAWVRNKDSFYLYKGGKASSVINEVTASIELQKLGFNVLQYELTTYEGLQVSRCQCFTDQDTGFVTAGNYNLNYDLKDLVLGKYKNQFWTMVLCDYLIGNSDRHQDNWGFLFDTNRVIKSLCPIFDFDHAFEVSGGNFCLPFQLWGEHITVREAAKLAVIELQIDITLLASKSDNNFINQRLQDLKK